VDYRITIKSSAKKSLARIPNPQRANIVAAIDALAGNSRSAVCKKLKASAGKFRVRVGDYRVVYVVSDEDRLVDVRVVDHRSSVYRK